MPPNTMKHYLRIDEDITAKRDYRYRWVCACGNAEGSGPTEEACEISHDRHLRRLRDVVRRAARRAVIGP